MIEGRPFVGGGSALPSFARRRMGSPKDSPTKPFLLADVAAPPPSPVILSVAKNPRINRERARIHPCRPTRTKTPASAAGTGEGSFESIERPVGHAGSTTAEIAGQINRAAQTAAYAVCGFSDYGPWPGVAATLRRQRGGLNPPLQKLPRAPKSGDRAKGSRFARTQTRQTAYLRHPPGEGRGEGTGARSPMAGVYPDGVGVQGVRRTGGLNGGGSRYALRAWCPRHPLVRSF
jgi:hypothetical protein